MKFTIADKEIDTVIENCLAETVALRRTIHQNPELSGSETETSRVIYDKLKNIGLKPSFHLEKTAVSATIENGQGKTIVLRADMDALPIQEETDLPFASGKSGIMHACGHDMHSAILWGAASALNAIRNRWKGKIVLLFQPSEEVEPGGAFELIEAGVFPRNADAVFGLHVSTDHECGIVGLKEGIDYAGITTFDITINGKGGHGGTPEKTVDPIVCAATIITQLQAIISREISRFIPATLTIGSLHAGSLRNIIPDKATMQGTIRTHSKENMELIIKRIHEMVDLTAKSFRAAAEVTFYRSYPPGFNSSELLEQFSSGFSSIAGSDYIVKRTTPTMYAEDFSYFQELVPGLYIHLGVAGDEKAAINGIHTSRFNPDERAIKTGITAHVAFSLQLLK